MVNLCRRMGPVDSRHLYRVTTPQGYIEVDANNERDARFIAEHNGYQVLSLQEIA